VLACSDIKLIFSPKSATLSPQWIALMTKIKSSYQKTDPPYPDILITIIVNSISDAYANGGNNMRITPKNFLDSRRDS
jgi:hypothetical protein